MVWGLTGGIASGKSTAGLYFAEKGIPVIDADQISRTLSDENGSARPAIEKRFGTADRIKLREIVFQDENARKDLEAILHPLIVQESQKQIAHHQSAGAKLIIYEATLLVETGRYKTLDGLVVVSSAPEKQLQRLISHRAMPAELAGKIIKAQISNEARQKAATYVIENNGTLEDLRAEIQKFLEQILVDRGKLST